MNKIIYNNKGGNNNKNNNNNSCQSIISKQVVPYKRFPPTSKWFAGALGHSVDGVSPTNRRSPLDFDNNPS